MNKFLRDKTPGMGPDNPPKSLPIKVEKKSPNQIRVFPVVLNQDARHSLFLLGHQIDMWRGLSTFYTDKENPCSVAENILSTHTGGRYNFDFTGAKSKECIQEDVLKTRGGDLKIICYFVLVHYLSPYQLKKSSSTIDQFLWVTLNELLNSMSLISEYYVEYVDGNTGEGKSSLACVDPLLQSLAKTYEEKLVDSSFFLNCLKLKEGI